MARRNAHPLTFRPKGLSDAIDGSNAFKGAMQQLSNLVPASTTNSLFVPRAASILETDFTTSGFTTPGVISCLLAVGTRIYGMIGTADFSGKDRPFCYDIAASAFISITGPASTNLPVTQSSSGDWQPPHMEMIANRIIVTHPGFPGGAGPYFGWIDLTGFSSTGRLVGNTTSGSNVIQSISGDGTSTPILDGVQPGQAISGTGIPAGTFVQSVTNGTTNIATTATTNSTTALSAIPASAWALLQIGMYVTGSGILAGTYISALPSSGNATLSQAATSSASGVAIQVIGGGTITMTKNATANGSLVALTVTGGTFAAPVWGAGNTNVNPLTAPPAWVSLFNGRAWFAVGNAEVFSDSLLPLNVSLATQVLTLGDSTAVTCSSGMPLNNITTGGVIQSLIAFKGAAIMYQITGDQATNNLSVNSFNVSVGTNAPNTVVSTPLGLAFVAPDGLRIIDFSARVSEPLGANGAGVSLPFINALTPTRMVAAFNQNVLRISCQNSLNAGQPVQEFWMDFTLKIWTGPHTFPAQAIVAYQAASGATAGHGFVSAGYGVNAKLWLSGTIPLPSDTYVENGVLLSWAYEPVLLPDNDEMCQNRMGQAAIAMALPGGQSVGITFANEIGTLLNQVQISSASGSPALWGSFNWGATTYGLPIGFFRQYNIPWTVPIIFKQGSITFSGSSQAGFVIGNLYLKYQPLGYLLNVLGATA